METHWHVAKLNELPQLVGQMSFVGPRPLLPVDHAPAFSVRLALRPGLTGWAPIKKGRELTASDKAALASRRPIRRARHSVCFR